MINITDVVEIMRLSEEVYESDKLPTPETVKDFKEVSDSHNTKRYLRFVADYTHSKYLSALEKKLQKFGNGDAVIRLSVGKPYMDVLVLDTDKITDMAEDNVLSELVANTMIKMDAVKMEGQIYDLLSKKSSLQDELVSTRYTAAKTQAAADKLKSGIRQIKDASKKTKAGLGSRKVNALKDVIDQVSEKVK